MKEKSVKINAALNVIKSLLSVIFPLITYPYATRILGVENLGKVNYSESIVSYFSLLAAFGITTYAIREGAKVRNEKKKFEILSNELFSINITTTIGAYILLFIAINISTKLYNYKLLILLQSLTIVFTTFSMDWINIIYEDYVYVTIRGIITHILSLIFLFFFVKTREDYYIYASLTVASNAVVCILNYFYCKKYVKICFVIYANWKFHLKKMSVFFVNAVAVSIYVSADTTMLGWMRGDYPVGIYSIAVKIYSIMKLILSAIYSVTIPRLTLYYSRKNEDEYNYLISNIISFVILLLLPIAAGICMFSNEVVLVIAGDEFASGGITLTILGIALVFAILGGLITQCVNIPIGRERINATATIISAIENILLNIPFIMLLSQNGAAITTAISEATVLVYCCWNSKEFLAKHINSKIKKNFIESFIGIIIVIIVGVFLQFLSLGKWITLVIGISFTILIYLAFLIMIKNELILMVLSVMKDKIKRRT